MKSRLFWLVLALFALSSPMFAQATGAPTAAAPVFPSPIAMAIASGLCGLGQGKAIAASAEAVARNPSAANVIRTALILGLAFIESLALFTLVIVFAKG